MRTYRNCLTVLVACGLVSSPLSSATTEDLITGAFDSTSKAQRMDIARSLQDDFQRFSQFLPNQRSQELEWLDKEKSAIAALSSDDARTSREVQLSRSPELRHAQLHWLVANVLNATIGFKSARKKMATGIGTAGTPPSEGTIYEKLKSLELKGCIEILSSERSGTRVRFVAPDQIPGVNPGVGPGSTQTLEEMDFFTVADNRRLILEREGRKCFYCLAVLNGENYVIEHVVSRPSGDNSYRNVVAACRQCNNRKSAETAEDFLRTLYREGMLSSDDFKDRISNIERLRAGDLRPPSN